MSLFSRSKEQEAGIVVRDFDKLVAQPVSFKLHGKVHTLNPVTVQEFWAFTEAMIKIQNLSTKPDVSVADLTEAYLSIFKSACPTITLKDVENMTQPQVAALLQFVVDTIKGASQVEDYDPQKKNHQSPKES
jgi:hypothetical protein